MQTKKTAYGIVREPYAFFCKMHIRGKKRSHSKEEWLKDVGHDLSSRLVAKRVLSALQSLTTVFGMGTGGPSASKRPTKKSWQQPIFPARRQASIVGTSELNYRVRNGNGWTLCVTSPTIMRLQGFEPGTHWLRVSCSTNWAKGAFLCPQSASGISPEIQIRPLKTEQSTWK